MSIVDIITSNQLKIGDEIPHRSDRIRKITDIKEEDIKRLFFRHMVYDIVDNDGVDAGSGWESGIFAETISGKLIEVKSLGYHSTNRG